jgi:hypothetical protein
MSLESRQDPKITPKPDPEKKIISDPRLIETEQKCITINLE